MEQCVIINFREARKKKVAELMRQAGEVFAYSTILCGVEGADREADIIVAWLQSNYPEDVEELAKEFMQATRAARRKIFRTDEEHNLLDDPLTMLWLSEMRMRCPEFIYARQELLAEFKANT